MKKIVFTAVVLAVVFGVSNTTNAFWGFSKKANKAEVKSEQAENNMAATNQHAIKGESEVAKLVINKEGSFFSLLAGGAVVGNNSGGNLSAEISFGSSKIKLGIKTNADTKVFRHYDGKSVLFNVADIAVGDVLSFEGNLDMTADSLTVTAKKIKDFSAQRRDSNYSGTIKTIGSNSFVLDLPNNEKDLTVSVTASTTIKKFIKKNQSESLAPISFGDLKIGDTVKNATGIVNTQTMQMTAKEVVVTERDIAQRKIKDIFAEVVSVDVGNSMKVKTTANVMYIVSLKNSSTVYNKWTISKKYSGVKNGSKTDGVTELSTLEGLALVATNKVWISGDLDIKTGVVVPSLIEKEFYK